MNLSNMDYENSYSCKDWIRLQDTWNAIIASRALLQNHSDQIDNIVSEENSYRNFASELQNRQIRLMILEEKTNKVRELVRKVRYRLNIASAENTQFCERLFSDEKKAKLFENEFSELMQQNNERRMELVKIQNELLFRRRHMFRILYETLFSKIKNCSRALVFKKQCLCLKFDVIRGLHFPVVSARLGHDNVELSAAAGYLVQLLFVISQILSFPLKHLLVFNGSRSLIINRLTLDCFDLYLSPVKSNRNRLDEALYYLTETIIQLRTDTGVLTREKDRPIRLVQELLLSYAGYHKYTNADLIYPLISRNSKMVVPSSLPVYTRILPARLTDDSKLCNLLFMPS